MASHPKAAWVNKFLREEHGNLGFYMVIFLLSNPHAGYQGDCSLCLAPLASEYRVLHAPFPSLSCTLSIMFPVPAHIHIFSCIWTTAGAAVNIRIFFFIINSLDPQATTVWCPGMRLTSGQSTMLGVALLWIYCIYLLYLPCEVRCKLSRQRQTNKLAFVGRSHSALVH